MKRPRLNQLRTFEVAARRLSFSAAAKELSVSQAAVSQQMRQLEEYLGATLFDRQSRNLALTGVGQAYFEAVHTALDRLDAVTDRLFPGRERRTVNLLVTSSVAALWLVPRLRSFQRQHPEIDLRINTLDRNRGDRGTNADLEIRLDVEDRPDATFLLCATVTPVCAPALLARPDRPRIPDDLHRCDLVHVLGYEDDWHRWLRRFAGHRGPVPEGLSVDSSLIAIEAAQRGEGIMLGRRPFIDKLIRDGDLVELFPDEYHLSANYYLRYPSSGAARAGVEDVAEWLQRLAREA